MAVDVLIKAYLKVPLSCRSNLADNMMDCVFLSFFLSLTVRLFLSHCRRGMGGGGGRGAEISTTVRQAGPLTVKCLATALGKERTRLDSGVTILQMHK
jgi:hypothetical protein